MIYNNDYLAHFIIISNDIVYVYTAHKSLNFSDIFTPLIT